jgi:hypothetical protein
MRRQISQLAGFIDQAGLFRTLFAITNKLHFSLPSGFLEDYPGFPGTLHGTVRGEIQPQTGRLLHCRNVRR